MMVEVRDCEHCVWMTRDGCSTWGCEYINRGEAIQAYRSRKDLEELHRKLLGQFLDLEKEIRKASAEVSESIRKVIVSDPSQK